jgi:hypothetical protein
MVGDQRAWPGTRAVVRTLHLGALFRRLLCTSLPMILAALTHGV